MRPSLLSAVALTIVALYALPAAAQTNQGDTAQVEFEDQTMDGDMVVVASVTLPQGGFVVIHDDRLLDGDAAGSVVGTSEFLTAGTHTDVEVTIDMTMMDDGMDNTTDDTNNDTGGTTNGGTSDGDQVTLIAMPHMDTNNNQVYDFVTSSGADDGPYTQSGGGAVTAQAQVTKDDSDDGLGDDQDDGLDDPGDDGFPDDGEDDDVVDGEDEDTPGFEAVALLALLGAVAVFRRR